MSKKPIERIEFLAKRFNVLTDEEANVLANNKFFSEDDSIQPYQCISDIDETGCGYHMAIYKFKTRGGNNVFHDIENTIPVYKNIRITENVFIKVVQADPTDHKEYVQWMLTTFVNYIKKNKFGDAIRFITEDLWRAEDYLRIFYVNRHKPKFKKMCSNNLAFKNVKDPSNINQYRGLSQLFDAVDPYIKKDLSKLERDMGMYVNLREAEIPFRDRAYTVFIPRTVEASRLFKNHTNWCTTGSLNSFNNYVKDYKTPFRTNSKLYIIIDNRCFLPDDDPNKSNKMYQLHFESKQMMNKSDGSIKNIKSEILSNSVGLSEYFYDLLIELAKEFKNGIDKNPYYDGLIRLGFTDVIFEIMKEDVDSIQLLNDNIETLPDMSKFTNLDSLYLYNVKLTELHDSVCNLTTLGLLSLANNKLKTLPKNINKLKNLTLINISGNNIEELPESIGELDKTNGGHLERFSYGTGDLDDNLLGKLKILLPTTAIVEYKNNE
jgi:hypothetical protein